MIVDHITCIYILCAHDLRHDLSDANPNSHIDHMCVQLITRKQTVCRVGMNHDGLTFHALTSTSRPTDNPSVDNSCPVTRYSKYKNQSSSACVRIKGGIYLRQPFDSKPLWEIRKSRTCMETPFSRSFPWPFPVPGRILVKQPP